MFYPLYSTKKLIVPNLTTKGVISKLPDKLFCYAKQRNMLFIVHNPEAKNLFFFPTGLKVSSVFKYFVENKCDRKQPQYKIDGIRHKWFLFYVRNTRSVVLFQMWASSVFYWDHTKCSTSLKRLITTSVMASCFSPQKNIVKHHITTWKVNETPAPQYDFLPRMIDARNRKWTSTNGNTSSSLHLQGFFYGLR